MTTGSGCWVEGRHTGLCCWCKTNTALMCFSWDVSCHLLGLPGACRAGGGSSQLEVGILPVGFSEHLWKVFPPRVVATAKTFWGFFLHHWRKCFCPVDTKEEGDNSKQPRGGDGGRPLTPAAEAMKPRCLSPISCPGMQTRDMGFQAGTQFNF